MRVSVIGGGRVLEGESAYAAAREVGRRCGRRGHSIVCGGRGGVMGAACRGLREGRREGANRPDDSGATARAVGVLPGTDPAAANDCVDVPIATGLGNARNVLVALNGRAVVAIDGSTGTLSEIGHALDFGRPVAAIDGPDLSSFDGYEAYERPVETVESIERRAED